VLPAVRTSFNHSGTSCLRDGMMLLLASGTTYNRQKNIKIEQFSTKNAQKLKKTTKIQRFLTKIRNFVSFKYVASESLPSI